MSNRIKVLYEILRKSPPFVIAFSGGVDSTFLAAVASHVCSAEVVAMTADSVFLSDHELRFARKMAGKLDIKHYVIPVEVLKNTDIIANGIDRCYFCKKTLFSALKDHAASLGFSVIAHGINIDDLEDFRPGIKAAREMGIFEPLIEAGLSKSEIRDESKKMGLDTWNMPAQSCLATRIPFGERITLEVLERVEACESWLIALGLHGVRVRCHGSIARIECPSQMISTVAEKEMRDKIITLFKAHGFEFVALDLGGYIQGSMNPEKNGNKILF
ncbi:conserved hypothetical protein [Desulfamplus magnetovallimortis]|uniref:Uncharacterized protein n=1 Tax=Desulfamplus magnetovallimortis TaxID=1246637 RepID=A0A1W1HL53_9BACT|nr:ATP-dependent sacrificial sulfur transferase LarE [Desulfamplus magnetovallimortis]SLM33078.1 conserved hypothetical protein [Desulfamplus magnetovallimortis]